MVKKKYKGITVEREDELDPTILLLTILEDLEKIKEALRIRE